MLYLDTCALLAVLTSEAYSTTAATFLAQASAPLAISIVQTTARDHQARLHTLNRDIRSIAEVEWLASTQGNVWN